MKVYVYVEAYTPYEEYADIVQTKVFADRKEAREYLKKNVDSYRNHPEDGSFWNPTLEEDDYCHMIYDGNKDEVVMEVEEHEI